MPARLTYNQTVGPLSGCALLFVPVPRLVRPKLPGREMCRIGALQYPPGATKGCHACPPQSNDLSPNRQGPIHNTTKQGSEFSPSSRSFAPINAPIWIHIVSTFSRLSQLIQFSNYSYLGHWYTRAIWRTGKQSLLSVCPSGWFRISPTILNFILDFSQDNPFLKVIIDFAANCERRENVMRKKFFRIIWEKNAVRSSTFSCEWWGTLQKFYTLGNQRFHDHCSTSIWFSKEQNRIWL